MSLCHGYPCAVHGLSTPTMRMVFREIVKTHYPEEEEASLVVTALSAMLPDELGLSVLDDESAEVLAQCAAVMKYYSSYKEEA